MEYRAPESDEAISNFFSAFKHNKFLAADERDQRVGRLLHELDQISIHE